MISIFATLALAQAASALKQHRITFLAQQEAATSTFEDGTYQFLKMLVPITEGEEGFFETSYAHYEGGQMNSYFDFDSEMGAVTEGYFTAGGQLISVSLGYFGYEFEPAADTTEFDSFGSFEGYTDSTDEEKKAMFCQ